MGSSDKSVNEFKLGFGVEIDMVFLVGPMKDLNMIGIIYYQWGLNSVLFKIVNVRYKYW